MITRTTSPIKIVAVHWMNRFVAPVLGMLWREPPPIFLQATRRNLYFQDADDPLQSSHSQTHEYVWVADGMGEVDLDGRGDRCRR